MAEQKISKEAQKQIDNWISANKQLWKEMSAYERDMVKAGAAMTKTAKEVGNVGKEARDISQKIVADIKLMGKENKSLQAVAKGTQSIQFQILALEQKSTALSKKKVKALNGVLSITEDYLANQAAIGTEEFQSLDFTKKIRELKRSGLSDEAGYLKLMQSQYDVQKNLNEQVKAQSDLIKKPFGIIEDYIKGIPIVGDMLASKLDITSIGDKISEGFVTQVQESFGMAQEQALGWNDFQSSIKGSGLDPSERASAFADYKGQQKGANKQMKMGLGTALAIGGAITAWVASTFKFSSEMGVGFSQISLGMLLFKNETKALLDEFGSVNDVSNKMLFTMKMASFLSGVQAGDMAKIAMLQTSITGMSKEQALGEQAKFIKDIKKDGLSAAKVMGDLASNADMFANFAKDGGANMKEAAKQAARMGLDLSATNAVAEKLLDFESSIAAEQEVSMLLGRSINLDKARQLAFTGDLASMMTEVKNQAGGEAAFAAMNVVQRQALGDSIGLQGAQLSEFMKTENERTAVANKGLLGKLAAFAAIATVIGAIVGMIVVGIKGMKGAADIGAGAILGAKLGAGAGISGAAVYGGIKSMSDGSITPEGNVITTTTGQNVMTRSDDGIVVGKKLNTTQPGGGQSGMSMANTNSKLDKLISLMSMRNEQAEVQTKKLGRDMNNSFTAR
jgi:hypothetical protein